MSSRDTEKSVRIPSIQLSTKVLDDVCKLLKKEYVKFDKADKEVEEILLEISSSSKGTQRIRGLDALAGNEIPKNVRSVSLSLRGLGKAIRVHIEMDQVLEESYFTVQGTDNTWVNGMISSIYEIFREYKTHNDFFRSMFKSSVVYLPLAILFTYAVYLTVLATYGEELIRFVIIMVVTIPMFSAIGWYLLTRWLFPKFEMAHMLRIRVRNWILSAIGGGIVIGIILMYIQAYVQLPFISQ